MSPYWRSKIFSVWPTERMAEFFATVRDFEARTPLVSCFSKWTTRNCTRFTLSLTWVRFNFENVKTQLWPVVGDIILALNGGPKQTVGVSVDLATEQVVDVWAPTNGTFTDAHDLTLAHDQQSFFVCQLTTGHSKVIKFDLVDPTLTN